MSVGADHRPLRELVADAILQRILSGEFEPGTRLLEDRLAEELGVSRNPVRESIRALEATGLVEVRPRRGAYVVDVDRDDLIQLLRVRAVLEAYAAELATERRPDGLVDELDRCLTEGRAASEREDLVHAAECHRDFHLAIEQAAGNRYIGETTSPLRHRTEFVFSVLSDSRSMLSWDEHQRIRDAIDVGDPTGARERTTDHMTAVIEDLARAAT